MGIKISKLLTFSGRGNQPLDFQSVWACLNRTLSFTIFDLRYPIFVPMRRRDRDSKASYHLSIRVDETHRETVLSPAPDGHRLFRVRPP